MQMSHKEVDGYPVLSIAVPGGVYQCTTADMDVLIERYLPASLKQLKAMYLERHYDGVDMVECACIIDAITTVTQILIMFGDCDRPVSGFDW